MELKIWCKLVSVLIYLTCITAFILYNSATAPVKYVTIVSGLYIGERRLRNEQFTIM